MRAHWPSLRCSRMTEIASFATSSTCSKRLAIGDPFVSFGRRRPPRRSLYVVDKRPIGDRHLGLANLLARQRTFEDLPRQGGQDRVGDDVVDDAAARIGI